MTFNAIDEKENIQKPSQLYIAIDHLKEGNYQLNIMCENDVIKSVAFKK